jgi:hypothetical protein
MRREPYLAENKDRLRGMLLEAPDVMIIYIHPKHVLRSAGGEYSGFQSEVVR